MPNTIPPEMLDELVDLESTEEIYPEEEQSPIRKEIDSDGPVDEVTGLPEDVIKAILTCYKLYEEEDRPIREVMTLFWKKLENYFHGIQRIFLDATARDWRRVYEDEDEVDSDIDPTFYDKIVNVFRAHGESLIAALSIKTPNTIFYPDDADVVEDIDTAKACTKIDRLIDKHNDAILVFIKSLFILYNCGVVACYIYNRKSNKYGSVEIPNYGEDVPVTTVNITCQVCGNLQDQIIYKGELDPSTLPSQITCETCGNTEVPKIETTQELIPQIVGYTNEPKSRIMMDVFSPLYAYFPFYARKQEHIPYLCLKFEQHYAALKARYKNLVKAGKLPRGGSSKDAYERDLRTFSYWQSSEQNNLITTACYWQRDWAFEILEDEELVTKCKKYFPDGCYAVIINDVVAEAYNEDLDDHWEISSHPLSNFLHADPIGKPIAPLQELRNEAVDLVVETFEHSIPETFVDKEVLNFDSYSKERAKPGMKYPVKRPPQGSISDSFYADKSAAITEEHEAFIKRLDVDGQFVIGDFPSVYGGPATSGSKTAKEYVESRAMALQRLNTTWTVLKHWWARCKGKAVPLYIHNMIEDEKYVDRSKQSETGFVNVWIRQTELTGKLGSVEADSEEELPMSSAQLKSLFVELMTLNNETINDGLFHPQNLPLMTKALGAPDFHIPGSDDRDKQFSEIAELLRGQAI